MLQTRLATTTTQQGRLQEILATVREEFPEIPIGLLVYANLVLHRSAEIFYRDAAAAGVDSVLIADLPLREAPPVDVIAESHGIAPVHIAPPNADVDRLAAIAEAPSAAAHGRVIGAGVMQSSLCEPTPSPSRIKAFRCRRRRFLSKGAGAGFFYKNLLKN